MLHPAPRIVPLVLFFVALSASASAQRNLGVPSGVDTNPAAGGNGSASGSCRNPAAPARPAPSDLRTGPASFAAPVEIVPTPAARPAARSAPRAGSPTTYSSPVGPATLARPLATPLAFAAQDPAAWQSWWRLHRDGFLRLKDTFDLHGVVTGSDEFFLGDGEQSATPVSLRPSSELVHGRVVPALLHQLDVATHPAPLTAALLSLARIGEAPDDQGTGAQPDLVRSAIEPFLGHADERVAETATLALGVLGNDASTLPLAGLVAGNDARDSRRVPERRRAMAAYGLGLIGARSEREDVRRYVVHVLARTLEGHRHGAKDVPVACVQAIGLVPLAGDPRWRADGGTPTPSACREAQIEWLAGLLGAESTDRVVRAHVPASLARLGSGDDAYRHAAAAAVLEAVDPRRCGSRDLARGGLIALGSLGDADEDPLDRSIREELREAIQSASDAPTRQLAWIALARVAARPGPGHGRPLAGTDDVRELLMKRLSRGRSTDRAWIGLALGVLGHGLQDARAEPSTDASRALVAALGDLRAPDDRAALSLAAGLRREPAALASIVEGLSSGDEGNAGHAAVALGLIGERASISALAEVLPDSVSRPALLEGAAIGCALLADDEARQRLVALLGDSATQADTTAVLAALGRVGDGRSVAPLLDLLADGRVTVGARSAAIEALGEVCDRDELPWRTRYADSTNWLAATTTLAEVLP